MAPWVLSTLIVLLLTIASLLLATGCEAKRQRLPLVVFLGLTLAVNSTYVVMSALGIPEPYSAAAARWASYGVLVWLAWACGGERVPEQRPHGSSRPFPSIQQASLLPRAWAYVADVLFLALFVGLPLFLIRYWRLEEPQYGEPAFLDLESRDDRRFVVDVGAVLLVLFLLRDAFAGCSLGKLLAGIRVLDATTGRPVGVTKALGRNLSLCVPILPLVELLVASLRDDGRRLGDLWAGTLVADAHATPNFTAPPPLTTSHGPETSNTNRHVEEALGLRSVQSNVDDQIRFHCPECGARLKSARGTSGNHGTCPCGARVTVPAE